MKSESLMKSKFYSKESYNGNALENVENESDQTMDKSYEAQNMSNNDFNNEN